MENKTGLKPLGKSVLVDPYDSQPELRSAVIAIPQTVKDRVSLAEQEAVVLEVGPEAWREERQPRAKPGERVMISKYAGTLVVSPVDKKSYRVVNANDIFLRIDDSAVAQMGNVLDQQAA